jgi:hypothetical protein
MCSTNSMPGARFVAKSNRSGEEVHKSVSISARNESAVFRLAAQPSLLEPIGHLNKFAWDYPRAGRTSNPLGIQ